MPDLLAGSPDCVAAIVVDGFEGSTAPLRQKTWKDKNSSIASIGESGHPRTKQKGNVMSIPLNPMSNLKVAQNDFFTFR